ncbi:MAG: hypothetical protein AMXMBFR67_29390 [Nitrospira sp.]
MPECVERVSFFKMRLQSVRDPIGDSVFSQSLSGPVDKEWGN